MPLDPRRLLILRTVRRTGSVLGAAHLLHLTPSGVSQHLTKLENELGLDLVDREHRGGGRTIRFTPAGNALADRADRVAEALAEAELDMEQFRDGPAGPLRIGGFSVALSELAAPVAMRMAAVNPALDPCIYEISETERLHALSTGELDLILSERPGDDGPVRPPGVVEVDLMRDPFRVVVPVTWPSDSEPATLLARPWITTSFGPATRRHLERMCREHGLELDAHDIGTGTTPTLLGLVAHGLGATIIPSLTLRQNPSPNVRLSNAIADPGSRVLTCLHRENAPALVHHMINEMRHYAATELQHVPSG